MERKERRGEKKKNVDGFCFEILKVRKEVQRRVEEEKSGMGGPLEERREGWLCQGRDRFILLPVCPHEDHSFQESIDLIVSSDLIIQRVRHEKYFFSRAAFAKVDDNG